MNTLEVFDMTGMRIGYKRVSSVDQSTERQLDGIAVDETFEDKASGKDTNRPQLQAALKHCRKGDTLVVHSMDRLARNLGDLLKMVKELTERGIVVEFTKEHLTFTGDDSPMSNLMLAVMGGVAQFERAMIQERQREGIAIAKTKGVYKGRKPALNSERIAELRQRASVKDVNMAALAREFKVSRTTLYNTLNQ
jgi:DNA invertase Pin-like site-specific DNA recombinase